MIRWLNLVAMVLNFQNSFLHLATGEGRLIKGILLSLPAGPVFTVCKICTFFAGCEHLQIVRLRLCCASCADAFHRLP